MKRVLFAIFLALGLSSAARAAFDQFDQDNKALLDESGTLVKKYQAVQEMSPGPERDALLKKSAEEWKAQAQKAAQASVRLDQGRSELAKKYQASQPLEWRNSQDGLALEFHLDDLEREKKIDEKYAAHPPDLSNVGFGIGMGGM